MFILVPGLGKHYPLWAVIYLGEYLRDVWLFDGGPLESPWGLAISHLLFCPPVVYSIILPLLCPRWAERISVGLCKALSICSTAVSFLRSCCLLDSTQETRQGVSISVFPTFSETSALPWVLRLMDEQAPSSEIQMPMRLSLPFPTPGTLSSWRWE